jgi:ornithine cyclodeaminase
MERLMATGDLRIVTGEQVRALLEADRPGVVEAVRQAYLAWGRGDATPPDSTFLRFPGRARERIIALPAWLGGAWNLAGIKWIASFPENTRLGLDRASATLVLNDMETGYPIAMLESSVISAWRTAASAALAASVVHPGAPRTVGVIGAGLIAWETVRFLRSLMPTLERIIVHDLSAGAADHFLARASDFGERSRADSAAVVLASADVTVLATTAITPHIAEIPAADHPRTLLHVSLRDLEPACLLAADNTADDVHHVNQARTSVHLLSEQFGHAGFLRAGMADLLSGRAAARDEAKDLRIFHPFGLGMLDLAVGAMALSAARSAGVGTVVEGFLPRPWRAQ